MRDPESREHSLAKHSGTEDLQGPAHSLKDRIAHKESPASEALIQGITQQQNPLGILIIEKHIVAHIELHIKVILLVEVLLQGNTQQHILVVCQILQEKTEEVFVKGHHPLRHTSDHIPPIPSKSESKCSVLTPEQRKHILTLVRSIKIRKTDTKPTKESEPTTSETPSKHKSPIKSKDLPPDTPFSSETRDNPSPAPPPSEDIDSRPSSKHSEVTSLPPSSGSPASLDSTTPRSPCSDRTPSPNPTMGTMKELAGALTDKLKDIGRHHTIPLPQFRGKKGEDQNDHCMKMEDYFSIFKIESDEDQKKRFLETLFEKARRWASTIDKLDGYKDKYTRAEGKVF